MRTAKKRFAVALLPRSAALACLLAALAVAGCGKGEISNVKSGMGTVTILTEPQGAVIQFDGSARGWAYAQKPIVIKGVAYGWHTIKATLPGRVPRIEEVRIDGKQTRINLRLEQNSFGKLSVIVDPPGAEVFVDSRYHGLAEPKRDIDSLAIGEHTLWLRLKGFRSERRSIVVERQFHRSYRLRMKVER